MNNINLQTTSGNSLVTNPNGQAGSLPEIELLQQKYLLLEKIGQLAEAHGSQWVERCMHLGGFAPTAPEPHLNGNGANAASPTSSSADLFGEVESLGLELNPNLITLIVNSSVQQVKTVIAKYKTYRKLTNPEGLFYRILHNECKSDHSSLS